MNLPTKIEIAYQELRNVNLLDSDEIDGFILNYLSNNWGYCVNSYTWKFRHGFIDDDIIVEAIDWGISEQLFLTTIRFVGSQGK